MAKNNNTLTWRVTKLEENYQEISKKIDEISENHLPHLREDMATIKSWMKVWAVFNFGAIVLSAVLLRFL